MIEVIAGTNRPGSNALKVAKLLVSLYQEEGVDVGLISLEQLPRELLDPTSYATKPAAFQPIQDRVLKAKGLHIVTPEYNGSFPGILKYFIDMLKFPESFEHRAVAFTGEAAGIWGAFRSVEQLQMIFGYRNAYILPERVFIPGIGKCFNEQGEWTNGEIKDRLHKQAQAFAAFARKVA
jgi:chromate reductase